MVFSVQPLFAKMLLPLLGGAPQVWNTCMVFFQAVLLAGYSYAHFLGKMNSPRRQVAIHLLLMLAACLFLPFLLPANLIPPTNSYPVPWILGVMCVSIGLPFFILSSSAPLLQLWYGNMNVPSSDDPYFLYAASNLGSMIALLSYPFYVETVLTLSQQNRLWSVLYYCLIGLFFCCALLLIKSEQISRPVDMAAKELIHLARKFRWILLSFVPSSMMLGLTSFISADLASAPLLWVIPLVIYLLTFTLSFSRLILIPHKWIVYITPLTTLILALCLVSDSVDPLRLIFPLHLFAFFVVAMLCHGELAKDRPGVKDLTLFYLLISVGGVSGGVFNSILSPLVFDSVLEYPLILVLALYLCPRRSDSDPDTTAKIGRKVLLNIGLCLLPALSMLALSYLFAIADRPSAESEANLALNSFVIFGGSLFICYLLLDNPLRLAGGFLLWMLAGFHVYSGFKGEELYQNRSYFGVHKVVASVKDQGRFLYHGSTTHGFQSDRPGQERVPGMYYHPTAPAGQLLSDPDSVLSRVSIVGLGSGALAAFAREGDYYTFLEIDPLVVKLAEDVNYFTFLADARKRQAQLKIMLGDARLTLAGLQDFSQDVIIVDAFSSGSIPVHLITLEAINLYLSKLNQNGILLFHISNHYLDFQPVLSAIARAENLQILVQNNLVESEREAREQKSASKWLLLTRTETDISHLPDRIGRWRKINGNGTDAVWTDNYSAIVTILNAF